MTLEQLKQKQSWFLKQTCERFNSNNRGIADSEYDICSYTDGCAVGCRISKRLAKKLDNLEFQGLESDIVFNLLPKHLKDLGQTFLRRVQKLHDHKDNWDSKGLSMQGNLEVVDIKQEFELI